MNLKKPLRFERVPPLRLEPFRHVVAFHRFESPAISTSRQISSLEFTRLLARYKRVTYEWSYLWNQSQFSALDVTHHLKIPIPMLVHAIIEPFTSDEWIIEEWTIKFLLSERLLTHARKQAKVSNWYEDPLIAASWEEVILRCFRSVQKYHKAFHIVPMIGDRLFNEDTGLRVQDRSIDGDLMTITFTLDS